jgi:hypothetical protein
MDDRTPADLANVLFIAVGLGSAFACAYLVRRPELAARSLRVWMGAALVAIPGLLLGVAMTQPQMGMRAAYRGLTRVLSEPLTFEARIVVVPRPKVSGVGSPDEGGPQGVPGLSPSADATEGSVTARDGVSQDPAPSSPPPVSPAPTVATTPPPTESPSPSAIETTVPPTPPPTETTPPPSPSVVTEP